MEGLIYRAARQSETDPLEYVLSDETVDRYGDVIAADGWDLSEFKLNPIALFNHNTSAVVGSWEQVRVESGRLVGRLRLAAQGTSRLVDEVRRLVDQRILKAVSVGFYPKEYEPLNDKADPNWGPFRYLKNKLVECSLVAVPANPNALQIGKSFELPAEIREQLRGKIARAPLNASAPLPGKLARRETDKTGNTTMSKLSKRIEDAQNCINQLKDQLTNLTNLDDPTEDDLDLMAELPDQIRDAEEALERDRRIETALAVKTLDDDRQQQQRQPEQRRPFAVPQRKFEPRDLIIRGAAISLLAHINKQPLENVARALYGNDDVTMWMVKAVTDPGKTTVPTWAAELVQQAVAEFLNLLPVDSIYPRLSAMGTRFTFGRNGSIKIPARNATPNVSGAWVGEGEPIPVRKLGLTSVTLTPKKLGVISTFTRELALHSTPAIEGVVRDAMGEDTAITVDTTLIDANPASTIRPAGLLNGVTPIPADTAGDPMAMVNDIKALIAAITASRGGRRIAILLNPEQGIAVNFMQTTTGEFLFTSTDEAGRRLGITFIISPTVPAKTVIAVDAADFASATGDTPEYDVSDQATIHEEDTNPLPIVAGTPASPVRSLWQTATIGVRMLLDMNWAMRRAGMVAYIEDVEW
jgi:HK97 family phage major capsid protein/HK97 family phage prohead protease